MTPADWLLQGYWSERPDWGWVTFHSYSGDRPRPAWPAPQAKRLRREGYRLRTVRA